MRGILSRAAAAILIVTLGAASAPNRETAHYAETAIFDLCPRLLDGKFSLDDEAAVEAVGFRRAAPRRIPDGSLAPQIERVADGARILFTALNVGSPKGCTVLVDDPEIDEVYDGVVAGAVRRGYPQDGPESEAGITRMTLFKGLADHPSRAIVVTTVVDIEGFSTRPALVLGMAE